MIDSPGKISPETLELRAKPRPIRRLNRRPLMIACGAAALLIGMAAIMALDTPRLFSPAERPELLNTERKQTAEALEKLPKTYADLPPHLGPPATGDVGRALVESEKKLGLPTFDTGFTPNPEEEAERAERIRQARIATQAKESGLFFRLSEKNKLAAASGQPADVPPASGLRLTPVGGEAAIAQVRSDAERSEVPASQAHKLAFMGAKLDKDTTNPHGLSTSPSPYVLMAGSVIAASLITGVNSDLPGTTIAQVTENVYDSVTGEHLLIPQGARLIGRYDSVVAFGQRRALLAWNRVILPNGDSIIVENLPASDPAGYTGLEDEVDYHTQQLLEAISLATLLEVGTEATIGQNQNDLVALLRQSAQKSANDAGQHIVDRQLDVQPTITVRPGWPVRVIVVKDLLLKPYRAPGSGRLLK